MTLLELIQAVSDHVAGGELLSTSTHPTKAQVTEWLNDGQRFTASIMPWQKMQELVSSASYAYTSAPAFTDFASDILDIISVTVDYGSGRLTARIAPQNEYQAIRNGDSVFHGTLTSPMACVLGNVIYIIPVNSGTMYIIYKKKPADLSGDSDTSDIGVRFDHALTVYAIAQFYKQNEQLDFYSKYFNDFLTILKGA